MQTAPALPTKPEPQAPEFTTPTCRCGSLIPYGGVYFTDLCGQYFCSSQCQDLWVRDGEVPPAPIEKRVEAAWADDDTLARALQSLFEDDYLHHNYPARITGHAYPFEIERNDRVLQIMAELRALPADSKLSQLLRAFLTQYVGDL